MGVGADGFADPPSALAAAPPVQAATAAPQAMERDIDSIMDMGISSSVSTSWTLPLHRTTRELLVVIIPT